MSDGLGGSLGVRRWLMPMAAVLVACAASAWAADATALCREADTLVRDSERKMFSRKYDEAAESLAKAEELIQQAKAADPESSRVKSIETKFERQKAQLAKRMGGAKPATKQATKPGPGKKPPAGDKLSGFVTSRLKRANASLDQAEASLKDESLTPKRRADYVARGLSSAEEFMAVIRKDYGDQIPAGHPDVKAVDDRIAAVKAKLAELNKSVAGAQAADAAAKAQARALADAWLAKLRPFIASRGQEGHDPEKEFISGGTVDVKELLHRLAVFNEASAVFAEYQKVQFPAGKPDDLAAVERDLGYRIKSFPEQLKGSMKSLADAAAKQIDDTAAFLARDKEWRTDPKKDPYVLSAGRVADLRRPLGIYKGAVGANDPKVVALETKLAAIVTENDERRKVATQRTYMIPDRFKGAETAALKAKAAELVTAKVQGVKVLRTTVISADWKEERKTEWTDTTRTVVRHRVTRSVTAQVAGKVGAQVLLYTVHLAQDRKTDGGWGALYGNLHQYPDPMLEANVHKSGP